MQNQDQDLPRFAHNKYLIRKQFFKIFGERFHIYDESGENVLLYTKLKAFKLKEDIRLFEGEEMKRELLRIGARQVLDIGATYDVFDPVSNEKVGALRRKGLKSTFLRDEWVVMDENGREVGIVQEDSTWKALLRKYVDYANIVLPQRYNVDVNGRRVMEIRQRFNPIVQKIELDFTADTGATLDRRLGLAIGVLLSAVEGRQN